MRLEHSTAARRRCRWLAALRRRGAVGARRTQNVSTAAALQNIPATTQEALVRFVWIPIIESIILESMLLVRDTSRSVQSHTTPATGPAGDEEPLHLSARCPTPPRKDLPVTFENLLRGFYNFDISI
jgi:hypothetical protein